MTEHDIKILDEGLPNGWLPEAEERLRSKGTPFSRGNISKVKTGAVENQVILDVLIELVQEERLNREAVSNRILQAATGTL